MKNYFSFGIRRRRTARWALLAVGVLSPGLPAKAAATGLPNDLGIQVIPGPVQIEPAVGYFVITPATRLSYAQPEAEPAAQLLRQALRQQTGWDLEPVPAVASDPESMMTLSVDQDLGGHGPEHYRLHVAPDRVTVSAAAPAGLVNGVQTVRQLLPIRRLRGLPDEGISRRLPCVAIEDYPRFGWRGLMLDCSRTFQSMDYLKRTVDRMTFYKLNVLHLHLTDDQGWRMEIRKYPELTARGARFPDAWGEPASHQGFYTQAELRDLVAYAAARNITVVPEIEMPGHTLAVLACYPHLSCTGGPFEIHPFFKGPGIHPDIFCAGNEDVFTFLEDVLTEVMSVFPSEFIHIGGDEAPKSRWEACPRCRARIRDEGLADARELQSWFIGRIARWVGERGRRVIGWDEILEGGLAPGAAVMSWRGTRGGVSAAESGHDVVMSPTSHCYFDYSYDRIDTLRAWSFEPTAGMDDTASGHVLGLQANFWSHIDREPELVDRQLFPRLLGIAERAWATAEARDRADFMRRARAHLARLDELEVAYHHEAASGSLNDPVGWWQAPVPEKYGALTWDVTARIKGPGAYLATLRYTDGAHRLGIERVELLAGGDAVASDEHRGETGAVHKDNRYRLTLPLFREGAVYTLRVSARSEGGTDSNGKVYLEEE